MKQVIKKSSEKGFSLVELMIVVGIISVLATLALPRFKQFQAKAKMGEAKNILSHIYTLEQSFALDNNKFLSFTPVGSKDAGGACDPDNNAKDLGFRIDPCNTQVPRFAYSANSPSEDKFTATAATGADAKNQVCPGNPTFSITLTETNEFKDVSPGTVCAK